MSYLYEEFFDVINNAIDKTSDESMRKLFRKLKVVQRPVSLSCQETARIMMGKNEMSQRAYIELRESLKHNNINIPPYVELKSYCKRLDVGNIMPLHHSNDDSCQCMGFGSTARETLQYVFKCPEYAGKMQFLSEERNSRLSYFLKSKDGELYKNFDPTRRTLILRETGDNFRSVGRYPTEQTSFCILNLIDLASGPYGQFITTLWRGSESRRTLKIHCKAHYDEMTDLVKNSVTINHGSTEEVFNVVLIFVADLSFVKEVLGKCSCTHTYGCFHCILPQKSWSAVKPIAGKSRSIAHMDELGLKVEKSLGENPNKDSVLYKKLTQDAFGQWVRKQIYLDIH